jgi:hypothetical protein
MSKHERIIFRATSADITKLRTLLQAMGGEVTSPSEIMRAVLRAATPRLVKSGLKKSR